MRALRSLVPVVALSLCTSLACTSTHEDEGTTQLIFTISGEETAVTGYAFPPTAGSDFAVVDGWEVRFDRILITVDDIKLTDNPDLSPTDQSRTGDVLARAVGPWAVNLSAEGAVQTPADARPSSLRVLHGGDALEPTTGRGSTEDKSVRLVTFDNLNLRGNTAFDPAQRYGVGYRVVAATAAATRVNLDVTANADYDEMIKKGWTTMYVGVATFKGQNCKSSDASYDFGKLPTVVKFRLGFATPTTYINCQNTDLTGKPFDGEEAQRGVQLNPGKANYAQLTFHLEHAFWDTVDHDQAKPFFDQMAAVAKDGVVTSDELATLDPAGFTDAQGKALPWRSCLDSVPAKPGQRKFDTGSVPLVGRSGDATIGLRHYADFASYQQSTMGHLNADGLCAIAREYPSPK